MEIDPTVRGQRSPNIWEKLVMIAMKHILVPTDFSEPSAIAIKYAKAFAEQFGATLHVLHVVEESAFVYTWTSPEGSLVVPNMREEMEKSAREQLVRVVSENELDKYHARLITIVGSPFVEVVRYAKKENIDLIVLGTHGRGAIAHMLMGSVAERVVRKAPCPVLTVRHPEHEFVMP